MKRVAAENEKEETDSKRQKIGEPGEKVMDISFDADSAMEMGRLETEMGTATQTEEFDYLFHTSTVKPPLDEAYFANDDEKILKMSCKQFYCRRDFL